jgi:hypothetical protein
VGMGDFQVHLNAIKFYKNCRGAIQWIPNLENNQISVISTIILWIVWFVTCVGLRI